MATIDAKDVIYFADDSEYMRRMYFFENALGKKEIEDRIQLLAGLGISYRRFLWQSPLDHHLTSSHVPHQHQENFQSEVKTPSENESFRWLI